MPERGLLRQFNKVVDAVTRWQRQVQLVLALLVVAYHVLLFFLPPAYRTDIYQWPQHICMALSVLMLWLTARGTPPKTINRVFFAIVGLWMSADMLVGILAHRGVSIWMVLDLLTITLMLLALLPVERGLLCMLLVYTAFVVVALLSGPVDMILLLNLALLMVMAAYLTLHGSYISSERAQNIKLRQELRFDGLTGALNRQTIEHELQRLCQKPQPNAMLLLLDLDYFKQVNDQYGHLVGDWALQRVAQAAQDEIGPNNFLGRWGGEEFMVLVSAKTAEQGQALAERVRQRVSELHLHSDGANLPPITISLGAVMLRCGDMREQIEQADTLLYAAKAAGRNRVMVASASPKAMALN